MTLVQRLIAEPILASFSYIGSVTGVQIDTSDTTWTFVDLIHALLQAPFYHVVFEVLLIFWIFKLIFFTSGYRTTPTKLTKEEEEELLSDWEPEPLVSALNESDNQGLTNAKNRIIDSKIAKHVSINGKKCLNLASLNFLGMNGREDIDAVAIETLHEYGVGTCGPRGFYGTTDLHLQLEDKIAAFMNCEEAIIYSYGFSAMASAIPAYSKRGDVIFCDEGACFSIQKGILASRSKVHYFKHNDMEDLERLLKVQVEEDRKHPKRAKVTRRFIMVEGLYANYGDISPLPTLVELKWKYKVRIFLDETMSFGVLGKTGRGVTEHFGVSVDEMDLICGSLENSLSAVGGFCCGRAFVIDHQRLSGLGYCFSASQPAMLVRVAIKALELMEESPDMVTNLQENAKHMHQELATIAALQLVGEDISPIKHLQLRAFSERRNEDTKKLYSVVNKSESLGLALSLASYLEEEEHCLPTPSIRVSVNTSLTKLEITEAVQNLNTVCEEVL